MNRFKTREYKKWLQQVLQKEELTPQEMERILDGQLKLSARDVDAALFRRCRLQLYPHIQGTVVPGKQETLKRVHAYLQNESIIESAKENESAGKKRRFFLRPATLVGCLLFCIILFNVSNDAVGYNIWNLFFSWDDETMEIRYNVPVGFKGDNQVEYSSKTQSDAFFKKLKEMEITPLLPTWMPEGYSLNQVESRIETDYFRWAAGDYICGEKELVIHIIKNTSKHNYGSTFIEKDEREPDIFEQGGIRFYVMDNLSHASAFWYDPPYNVSIAGSVTRAELRKMIDSMFEGSTK